MKPSYTENKTKLCGYSINYVQQGKGSPMILLHNGGGFWQTWVKQIDYFSKSHEVFGIDWPGFGESSELKDPLSLELLTNILTEFIAQQKLKNVVLIGNCIGGSAALNYSFQHAENVSSLLIFNICPGSGIFRNRVVSKLIQKINNRKSLKKVVSSIARFVFTKTPVKKKFPGILFTKNISKNDFLFKKYIDKIKEKKQTDSRVNMVFSVHTFSLENFLKPMPVAKAYLFWGEINRVTPLKIHGFKHRDLLNPKKFEIIEGGSHLCMYEQAEIVNKIIENNLNEI